jgi:subtilisin family serine protease
MAAQANRSRVIRAAALFGLALAVCLGIVGGAAQATAGVPAKGYLPGRFDGKVERRVLDDTLDGKSTGLVVLMSEQADLSAAYAMRDEDARGWYVYDTLKATAGRSQASLRAMLDSSGIAYKSYWAANMLVISSGDRVLVQTLAARADVKSIESNAASKGIDDPVPVSDLATSPNTVEWGVTRVNAPQVWTMGYTGQGIVIGNQDTGVRWSHNALKPHYRGWNGTTADHNFNWWDAVHSGGGGCGANSPFPCDDYGHGSHTTGTTSGDDGAGNQVGVAPGAKWIGCRNMNVGNGTPATYSECFQFFLAPTDLSGNNPDPSLRPHVMNNSWGCPPSEGCGANTLQTIVENSQAAGIFIEASAGNSGSSCSTVTDPPAIYAAAFSTGAIDINNTLASFSSRGPVTVDGSNRLKPNISAPGANVRSSTNTNDTSYGNSSGTSMAGPHVVGVVALLWSAHPELSRMITETKNLLQNTANPNVIVAPVQTCGGTPSTSIPNNSFGYGRVDALAAVNGAGPTATPTATATATRTSTPTRTATPLSVVQVRGHVLLQGRPAPPDPRWSVPVTLTLRLSPAGPTTEYTGITTDNSGYFTVTAPTPGTYDWRVKNPQTIANAGTVSLSLGTNAVEMALLVAGDINNDNCINVLDFSILKGTFGKSDGNPGYDARGDLNSDNTVNIADFNLLKTNFGLCGAGPLR